MTSNNNNNNNNNNSNNNNKLDFKGQPQRITKPISDQNLFSWFQSWCWPVEEEITSKDQAVLEIFYIMNQTVWLVERILGPKLKNQTNKLLELTGSIFYFYGRLPIYKK